MNCPNQALDIGPGWQPTYQLQDPPWTTKPENSHHEPLVKQQAIADAKERQQNEHKQIRQLQSRLARRPRSAHPRVSTEEVPAIRDATPKAKPKAKSKSKAKAKSRTKSAPAPPKKSQPSQRKKKVKRAKSEKVDPNKYRMFVPGKPITPDKSEEEAPPLAITNVPPDDTEEERDRFLKEWHEKQREKKMLERLQQIRESPDIPEPVENMELLHLQKVQALHQQRLAAAMQPEAPVQVLALVLDRKEEAQSRGESPLALSPAKSSGSGIAVVEEVLEQIVEQAVLSDKPPQQALARRDSDPGSLSCRSVKKQFRRKWKGDFLSPSWKDQLEKLDKRAACETSPKQFVQESVHCTMQASVSSLPAPVETAAIGDAPLETTAIIADQSEVAVDNDGGSSVQEVYNDLYGWVSDQPAQNQPPPDAQAEEEVVVEDATEQSKRTSMTSSACDSFDSAYFYFKVQTAFQNLV